MDTVEYYEKIKKTLADAKEEKVRKELEWARTRYSCCGCKKTGPHSVNCINADSELGFKTGFIFGNR